MCVVANDTRKSGAAKEMKKKCSALLMCCRRTWTAFLLFPTVADYHTNHPNGISKSADSMRYYSTIRWYCRKKLVQFNEFRINRHTRINLPSTLCHKSYPSNYSGINLKNLWVRIIVTFYFYRQILSNQKGQEIQGAVPGGAYVIHVYCQERFCCFILLKHYTSSRNQLKACSLIEIATNGLVKS